MFENPYARYGLRIGVVVVLSFLSVLKASLGDGLTSTEIVDLIAVPLSAGATYAGLGALVPSVEPFVGRTYKQAEVPKEADVKEV